MKVVVIGAGNGGAAAAVELTLAGHLVTVFARSEETLAPFRAAGIAYEGVFGAGSLRPAALTTDLVSAIDGADAVVVALPTTAIGAVARSLRAAGWGGKRPVILNPGHTGGALEFKTAWGADAGALPPIVEFATLAYVARKPAPNRINITGRAKSLRAAKLRNAELAMDAASTLFPGVYDCGSLVASDLSNINMVVHPPGAMLGASWVEATQGDFTFYVQGLTDGVVRVMAELDKERMSVGRAFGLELPTIIGEMKAVGTVPAEADDQDYRSIAAGEANKRIKAPDSLSHRYFTEDFTHGLIPFLVLAQIAGVATPVATSLVTLHEAMVGGTRHGALRDARSMGLESATLEDLLKQ